MADNYLEYAREDYEKRKAKWLQKKKGIYGKPKPIARTKALPTEK